jgi:hypothetical protein
MKKSTRARLSEAFDDITGQPHPSLPSSVIVGLRRQVSETEPGLSPVTRLVAIATAALLVVGLVAGIEIWSQHSPSSSAPATRSQAPLVTTLPMPQIVVKLSETPSDIAYDPGRNAVWLAQTAIGGPDYLDRIDTSSGTLTSFLLPIQDFAGPDSQIKVDNTGNVWMSDGYTLLRLDAGSKQVSSITLPTMDPDAVSGALDSSLVTSGTWITGIGTAGDGLLVARKNVTALVRLDSSFKEVSRFSLPPSYAGATDIYVDQSGRIDLLGGYTVGKTLGVFTSAGQLNQTLKIVGQRLRVVAGTIVVSGGLDNGALVNSNASSLSANITFTVGNLSSLAAPDPTGGEVLYDGLAGAIERVQNGVVTASYSVPRSMVCPPQPPGGGGCFPAASDVSTLTVDMRGDIWFTVSGSNDLQEIVGA